MSLENRLADICDRSTNQYELLILSAVLAYVIYWRILSAMIWYEQDLNQRRFVLKCVGYLTDWLEIG